MHRESIWLYTRCKVSIPHRQPVCETMGIRYFWNLQDRTREARRALGPDCRLAKLINRPSRDNCQAGPRDNWNFYIRVRCATNYGPRTREFENKGRGERADGFYIFFAVEDSRAQWMVNYRTIFYVWSKRVFMTSFIFFAFSILLRTKVALENEVLQHLKNGMKTNCMSNVFHVLIKFIVVFILWRWKIIISCWLLTRL